MGSVNKIRISGTTYDASAAPQGILLGFTSYDGTPSSWEDVDYITATETSYNIFAKLTKMIKNIRYTNDILLPTKASAGHKHSTNDISGTDAFSIARMPTSGSAETSSTEYVPTCTLVDTMNKTMESYGNYTTMGSNFTTNVNCGGIEKGTEVTSTKLMKDTVKNMLYTSQQPDLSEYEWKSLGTWSSKQDVDDVLEEHTYYNGWSGLKVGNYVTIQDGTYNRVWVIADFNCESAVDANTYGHSGGIAFIPQYYVHMNSPWHDVSNVATSYINSYMHTTALPTIKGELNSILGDHMVLRNVRLGSEQNGVGVPTAGTTEELQGLTSAYTDTTAYLTLMTPTQVGLDTNNSYNNIYDNGEANYCLRLFDSSYGEGNYIDFNRSFSFGHPGFRNVLGFRSSDTSYFIYIGNSDTPVDSLLCSNHPGIKPLMYLR